MNRPIIGAAVGLILGLALAFGSFGQMLIVLFFGLIGLVVGKVLAGEIDVSQYLSGRRSGR
ncbi:DUF2273 domain-containing protein [Nakamurella flava]|uniref:DUF2273 domain-containing protein n=1 Tax=Nakamurella flava TaxID=2576308 RepID=A0A4U6Q8J8_9ACTN|nr:DUF2273 domain-containing protein [Nakamurella flava]TKV55986.1 DUF2273 domain-containing protein [Nakamurella flava]